MHNSTLAQDPQLRPNLSNRAPVPPRSSLLLPDDGLGPLPDGWEVGIHLGRIHFINHNDKITTWDDPRRKRFQPNAQPNYQSNAQSNAQSNYQSNYQPNYQSNAQSSYQPNYQSNVQSNYQPNYQSNAQSNYQSNSPIEPTDPWVSSQPPIPHPTPPQSLSTSPSQSTYISPICIQCQSPFSILIKRRHCCYCCHRHFCTRCTPKVAPIPFLDGTSKRVCDFCFHHLVDQQDHSCLSRLAGYLDNLESTESLTTLAIKELDQKLPNFEGSYTDFAYDQTKLIDHITKSVDESSKIIFIEHISTLIQLGHLSPNFNIPSIIPELIQMSSSTNDKWLMTLSVISELPTYWEILRDSSLLKILIQAMSKSLSHCIHSSTCIINIMRHWESPHTSLENEDWISIIRVIEARLQQPLESLALKQMIALVWLIFDKSFIIEGLDPLLDTPRFIHYLSVIPSCMDTSRAQIVSILDHLVFMDFTNLIDLHLVDLISQLVIYLNETDELESIQTILNMLSRISTSLDGINYAKDILSTELQRESCQSRLISLLQSNPVQSKINQQVLTLLIWTTSDSTGLTLGNLIMQPLLEWITSQDIQTHNPILLYLAIQLLHHLVKHADNATLFSNLNGWSILSTLLNQPTCLISILDLCQMLSQSPLFLSQISEIILPYMDHFLSSKDEEIVQLAISILVKLIQVEQDRILVKESGMITTVNGLRISSNQVIQDNAQAIIRLLSAYDIGVNQSTNININRSELNPINTNANGIELDTNKFQIVLDQVMNLTNPNLKLKALPNLLQSCLPQDGNIDNESNLSILSSHPHFIPMILQLIHLLPTSIDSQSITTDTHTVILNLLFLITHSVHSDHYLIQSCGMVDYILDMIISFESDEIQRLVFLVLVELVQREAQKEVTLSIFNQSQIIHLLLSLIHPSTSFPYIEYTTKILSKVSTNHPIARRNLVNELGLIQKIVTTLESIQEQGGSLASGIEALDELSKVDPSLVLSYLNHEPHQFKTLFNVLFRLYSLYSNASKTCTCTTQDWMKMVDFLINLDESESLMWRFGLNQLGMDMIYAFVQSPNLKAQQLSVFELSKLANDLSYKSEIMIKMKVLFWPSWLHFKAGIDVEVDLQSNESHAIILSWIDIWINLLQSNDEWTQDQRWRDPSGWNDPESWRDPCAMIIDLQQLLLSPLQAQFASNLEILAKIVSMIDAIKEMNDGQSNQSVERNESNPLTLLVPCLFSIISFCDVSPVCKGLYLSQCVIQSGCRLVSILVRDYRSLRDLIRRQGLDILVRCLLHYQPSLKSPDLSRDILHALAWILDTEDGSRIERGLCIRLMVEDGLESGLERNNELENLFNYFPNPVIFKLLALIEPQGEKGEIWRQLKTTSVELLVNHLILEMSRYNERSASDAASYVASYGASYGASYNPNHNPNQLKLDPLWISLLLINFFPFNSLLEVTWPETIKRHLIINLIDFLTLWREKWISPQVEDYIQLVQWMAKLMSTRLMIDKEEENKGIPRNMSSDFVDTVNHLSNNLSPIGSSILHSHWITIQEVYEKSIHWCKRMLSYGEMEKMGQEVQVEPQMRQKLQVEYQIEPIQIQPQIEPVQITIRSTLTPVQQWQLDTHIFSILSSLSRSHQTHSLLLSLHLIDHFQSHLHTFIQDQVHINSTSSFISTKTKKSLMIQKLTQGLILVFNLTIHDQYSQYLAQSNWIKSFIQLLHIPSLSTHDLYITLKIIERVVNDPDSATIVVKEEEGIMALIALLSSSQSSIINLSIEIIIAITKHDQLVEQIRQYITRKIIKKWAKTGVGDVSRAINLDRLKHHLGYDHYM